MFKIVILCSLTFGFAYAKFVPAYCSFCNQNALVEECPEIGKCSDLKENQFTKISCESNDDCPRVQLCCKNPCNDLKQCMDKPDNYVSVDTASYLECPETKPCKNLEKDYTKWDSCETDDECLRKEKCCLHFCPETPSNLPKRICMVAPAKYTSTNYDYMFQ